MHFNLIKFEHSLRRAGEEINSLEIANFTEECAERDDTEADPESPSKTNDNCDNFVPKQLVIG